MTVEDVLEEAKKQVVPNDAEVSKMENVADELLEQTKSATEGIPTDAEVIRVGSTARDTWISGDRDIDIFVRFPTEISREELESYGLTVGHAVLPDGHEEYAEHPYVKGEYRGFDIDIVPCYDVDSATEIRSAVDRTPFHAEYIAARIDSYTDDVRLFKSFLSRVDAYGSNLRTRGFSGYLAELLVIEYGGFLNLLQAAADWSTPVELDPEQHASETFTDPLVVIDPTDPARNVAAVCSPTNVARLQHYARQFLDKPAVEFFLPRSVDPISSAAVQAALSDRNTAAIAIRFSKPAIVEDQLYPQLDKSLTSLVDSLDRGGFSPIRAQRFANDTCVLLVECAVKRIAGIERHIGPPLDVRSHAENFFETYHEQSVTGPFIEGHRYIIEQPREHLTPSSHVEATLFDLSLGPHVKSALETDYELLSGDEIGRLATEFGTELADYFHPVP